MSKILFCEDDDLVRKMLKVATRTMPHETVMAGDGLQALEIIERQPPDLIFLDLHMPGMTGGELTEALRGRAEWAKIPVVLMTGDPENAASLAVARHGAAGYLAKPFHLEDLRKTIQQLLPQIAEEAP